MVAHRLRALASIDRGGLSLARGLRAGLGCSVPLLLAEWLREPALSWAALIGFWVALVDPGWPPRTRVRAILFFIAGTASGCFLAVLARPHLLMSATFALLWCFAAILTRVGATRPECGEFAGPRGADRPRPRRALVAARGDRDRGLHPRRRPLGHGARIRHRARAARRTAPRGLGRVFRAEAAFVRDMIAPPPRLRPGAVREAIERARGCSIGPRNGRDSPSCSATPSAR